MHDYRIEAKVSSDRSLILKELPFEAGDRVEVIIRRHERAEEKSTSYPLRKKPFRYTDPFGGTVEEDWDLLR